MLRKLGSTLLGAALLASLFAGCGSSNPAGTEQVPAPDSDSPAASAEEQGSSGVGKLSFWKSPHSDREEEIWGDIISRFNQEYPDIAVEFLSVPWDSVNQKEMAAFAAGSPPDISFQVEQYPVYASTGKLVDINTLIGVEKLAAYPQGALDYCTYDGLLAGVPFVALNSVMFYNKDLFEDAGITSLPTTWDELVDAAQLCTKDTDGDGVIDQYGILLHTQPSMDLWNGVTFIQQAGGDFWNETRDNIGFNNDAGIRGVQFFSDLFNNYQVAPPIDTYSSEDEEKDAFYTEKIAMYPAQIHIGANIRAANPDLNLGAFLMPKGPAEDDQYASWSFANIGMLSIAADSPSIQDAWTFVEFATRPEVEKDYLSEVGFFSPQMETNGMMYQDDEIMQLAAADIGNMQTSPASLNFEAMYSGMKNMLETVVREAASPAQAIQQLEDDLAVLNS